MSKLRAAITFQHRIDEVKKIQQERTRENIAGPIESIIPIDELIIPVDEPIIIDGDNMQPQERNPTNIQEDMLEEEEINDESQVSSWNSLIEMWNQLLLQEEEAENDTEVDLDSDFDIEMDEILLNNTHPTLDNEAKWNIIDIFIDNLDMPFKDISDVL
jgi:hypothetical protein